MGRRLSDCVSDVADGNSADEKSDAGALPDDMTEVIPRQDAVVGRIDNPGPVAVARVLVRV